MREVATGVWQIPLAPRDAVNAYLLGDVLIDAGTSGMGKKLPARLSGRTVGAHAITHAHMDHVGGSRAVCDALGLELWAPAGDAEDVRRGRPVVNEHTRVAPLLRHAPRWSAPPIARTLSEGDEVAGFTVIDTPGHSPGHVAYWRESDRTLIGGDVFFNANLLTTRPGLHEPPRALTADPARNRESMRRLADLDPAVALFGHGPPLHQAGAKLRAFLDELH
jgi:hydroxyacylglutathione hydrolase